MSVPTPRATILVVDDDADIRETLVDVLMDEGYDAVGAHHGMAAIEYLRSHRAPALILLDIRMPVMDGFQFRAEQQKEPAWASVPVVALSADGYSGAKASVLQAAAWFRKPIALAALLEAVRQHADPPTQA